MDNKAVVLARRDTGVGEGRCGSEDDNISSEPALIARLRERCPGEGVGLWTGVWTMCRGVRAVQHNMLRKALLLPHYAGLHAMQLGVAA